MVAHLYERARGRVAYKGHDQDVVERECLAENRATHRIVCGSCLVYIRADRVVCTRFQLARAGRVCRVVDITAGTFF